MRGERARHVLRQQAGAGKYPPSPYVSPHQSQPTHLLTPNTTPTSTCRMSDERHPTYPPVPGAVAPRSHVAPRRWRTQDDSTGVSLPARLLLVPAVLLAAAALPGGSRAATGVEPCAGTTGGRCGKDVRWELLLPAPGTSFSLHIRGKPPKKRCPGDGGTCDTNIKGRQCVQGWRSVRRPGHHNTVDLAADTDTSGGYLTRVDER
jgi:hypothetical protein